MPSWVRNLPTPELKSVVSSRIESLMSNYKNEFVHWDVDNELLHWDFYEQKLGPNASHEFFQTAQRSDPLARMFMNDYNVVETCNDANSTVDRYVSSLQELKAGGVVMDGIGLEGHFSAPNPALIRGILDKLAVLDLPIWLTEVDISKKFDQETQVIDSLAFLCKISPSKSFSTYSRLDWTTHMIEFLQEFNDQTSSKLFDLSKYDRSIRSDITIFIYLNYHSTMQAKYLEIVLREGFSHPSVNGIILWSALDPAGCYQMCLTDNTFRNLPAGDVVDSLLKEWQTGVVKGETDNHGAFNFVGFHGEYDVSVEYGNRTAKITLSLSQGDETKHRNIQL